MWRCVTVASLILLSAGGSCSEASKAEAEHRRGKLRCIVCMPYSPNTALTDTPFLLAGCAVKYQVTAALCQADMHSAPNLQPRFSRASRPGCLHKPAGSTGNTVSSETFVFFLSVSILQLF